MAPSNTPPCNAVYDGSNYYYLPWSSEKPCVCVESYWENIAFRLEPLNALLRIIDRVVRLAIALRCLHIFMPEQFDGNECLDIYVELGLTVSSRKMIT